MTLAPGTRLGPYTIETLIGSGRMGEVYKAVLDFGVAQLTSSEIDATRTIAGDVSGTPSVHLSGTGVRQAARCAIGRVQLRRSAV